MDESCDKIEKTDVLKISGLKPVIDDIELSFCDDLNTPRAITYLFVFIQITEQFTDSTNLHDILQQSRFHQVYQAVSFYLDSLQYLDYLFAFIFSKPSMSNADTADRDNGGILPEKVKLLKVLALAEERYQLKKNKNFNEADNVRKLIQEYGYQIKDKKDGYEIILS
jgi:cysteinyl-tRNA synthetase